MWPPEMMECTNYELEYLKCRRGIVWLLNLGKSMNLVSLLPDRATDLDYGKFLGKLFFEESLVVSLEKFRKMRRVS